MSEEAAVVVSAPTATPTTPKIEESESSAEVAQNGGGPPSRVRLTDKQLETITKEELLTHWRDQDAYIDTIESQSSSLEGELTGLREALERTRQQHAESQHREKVLVRRLASKEQEMQDYASQLAELRAAQVPSAAALRSALLDPAASLLVQKLRQELAATKTRLEETQNELSAWKFTPDSNTGKRLMAKCRLLYQENEELGRVISSGRLAKLEGELALQKSFSDEVKKSQSELDEFLQELDEDVEGMQGTIYFLQQQLKTSKETVLTLTQELNALRQNANGTPQQVDEGEEMKGEECRGGEEESSWAGGEEEEEEGEEEEVTQDSTGVEEQPLEPSAEPMETEHVGEPEVDPPAEPEKVDSPVPQVQEEKEEEEIPVAPPIKKPRTRSQAIEAAAAADN